MSQNLCEREKKGMVRNCWLCEGYNKALYSVCKERKFGED